MEGAEEGRESALHVEGATAPQLPVGDGAGQGARLLGPLLDLVAGDVDVVHQAQRGSVAAALHPGDEGGASRCMLHRLPRDARGVEFAMDFLTQSTRRVAGDEIPEAELSVFDSFLEPLQPLEYGERERGGLPGAGLGDPQDVAAGALVVRVALSGADDFQVAIAIEIVALLHGIGREPARGECLGRGARTSQLPGRVPVFSEVVTEHDRSLAVGTVQSSWAVKVARPRLSASISVPLPASFFGAVTCTSECF